ncbi:MAG: hypothetical protein WAL24_09635 [Nitrososphaeraceae archaeon]
MPITKVKEVRARRQTVWLMLTKGTQQNQIAKTLGVCEATITKDVKALQDQSDQFLTDLARKTLPFMYEKSIEGITRVLEESWKIYNTDPQENPEITEGHRLNALRLAKDCNESLMKLFIDGPAVIAVRRVRDQLNEVTSSIITSTNTNTITQTATEANTNGNNIGT